MWMLLRIVATLALLCAVYAEAGKWTAVALFVLFTFVELKDWKN